MHGVSTSNASTATPSVATSASMGTSSDEEIADSDDQRAPARIPGVALNDGSDDDDDD